MKDALKAILDHLEKTSGLAFSGFRASFVREGIRNRLRTLGLNTPHDYLALLQQEPREARNLAQELRIHFSEFFRDPLTFEVLASRVLPEILSKKAARSDSLRVWSAGCARGEEPYSVAMLLSSLCNASFSCQIFATDIDSKALEQARQAIFPPESLNLIKYGLLKKHFTLNNNMFYLNPQVAQRVNFVQYDMLDKKSYAPPESIFGAFDIVFCRNLLLYFNSVHAKIILDKLTRSLSRGGFLILGEAEELPMTHKGLYRKLIEFSPIYQKKYGRDHHLKETHETALSIQKHENTPDHLLYSGGAPAVSGGGGDHHPGLERHGQKGSV